MDRDASRLSDSCFRVQGAVACGPRATTSLCDSSSASQSRSRSRLRSLPAPTRRGTIQFGNSITCSPSSSFNFCIARPPVPFFELAPFRVLWPNCVANIFSGEHIMYYLWFLSAILLAAPFYALWRIERSQKRELRNGLQSLVVPSILVNLTSPCMDDSTKFSALVSDLCLAEVA